MAQRTWDGGFIRADVRGRDVYVIRRMVDGVRYTVSTRAHSEGAATAQLRRFEADPGAYSPGGTVRKEPVLLTPKLVADFLDHSRDVDGNCDAWRHQQKVHLLHDEKKPRRWNWQDALSGVDLRRAKLDKDILPKLAGQKSQHHRIAVLKRLYSWLVSQGRIEPSEDPTFRRMQAPKSEPKEVEPFPVEHFKLVRLALAEPWRSIFIVQAGAGMHATEVLRFAPRARSSSQTTSRSCPARSRSSLGQSP